VISVFQKARVTFSLVVRFFSIVVDSAHSREAMPFLLAKLLAFHRNCDTQMSIGEFLRAALTLRPIVPPINRPENGLPPWLRGLTEKSLYEQEYSLEPPRSLRILTYGEEVAKEPVRTGPPRSSSPSYSEVQLPLSPGFPGMLTNSVRKSSSSGKESGDTGVETPTQTVIGELRSVMFSRFEALNVADDRLYAFLSDAQTNGILNRTILEGLYGGSWREVAHGIREDSSRTEIVRERCRAALLGLVDAKARANAATIDCLYCMPTFDLGPLRNFTARMSVPFCRSLASASLLEALSAVREDDVGWLCRAVMPRFLAIIPGNRTSFIGNDIIANALRLYGETCGHLCGLFGISEKRRTLPPTRTQPNSFPLPIFPQLYGVRTPKESVTLHPIRSERESFDACVEDAAFQLQSGYIAIARTAAGAFVRGAIAGLSASVDFEEMIDDAGILFAGRAKYFMELLYAYTRLAAVAAELHNSNKWEPLAEVADSHRGKPFVEYQAAMEARFGSGMLRIDVDYESDEFIVTPL
jgi:hypothetical protein